MDPTYEPPLDPSERPADSPPPRRRLEPTAIAALALALLAAIVAAFAGLGARWGLWHFGTGFQLLRWAAYGAMAAIAIAMIAIFLTWPGRARRGLPIAVVALLLAAAVAYVPWSWRSTARSVPPIHDITTDLENPPEFVAIVPLRADARNPVEHGGPEVAAHQRRGYPDIRPLVLDMPQDRAFQRALDTAHEMGWEIVDVNPEEGRIEATDRTFWFGFEDDVVIRLTPLNDRTVVDVRSLSRVGGGDAGTNARRVRKYLEAVQP